jgi:hypothetical protein
MKVLATIWFLLRWLLLVPLLGLILSSLTVFGIVFAVQTVVSESTAKAMEGYVAIGSIVISLPLSVWLSWRLLIGSERMSKAQVEEESRKFIHRLLHPDLAAVESHFGFPLPEALRKLYSDQTELMRGNFNVAQNPEADEGGRWAIAFYQPADEEAISTTWPGLEAYFAFADDGCGNGYVIDPKEKDPPVLFHDHETGELTLVCPSVSEFMLWPRMEYRERSD